MTPEAHRRERQEGLHPGDQIGRIIHAGNEGLATPGEASGDLVGRINLNPLAQSPPSAITVNEWLEAERQSRPNYQPLPRDAMTREIYAGIIGRSAATAGRRLDAMVTAGAATKHGTGSGNKVYYMLVHHKVQEWNRRCKEPTLKEALEGK